MRKLLGLGLIALAILLGVSAPSAAINLRQDDDGTKSGTIAIPSCTGSGKALTHDPTNSSTPFGCNTIAGGGLPSGLIAFFNGPCPETWTEVTGARGRIVVGTPSGGTDGATVGTALTDAQDKSVSLVHSGTAVDDHPSHTHDYSQVIDHTHPVNVNDPGHTHLTQRYPTTTGGSSGFTFDTSMSGTLADNTLPTKSATTGITATTSNPAGGVATGTTAGPSATLSHAVTQPSAHAVKTSDVLATVQYRVCSKD